MTSEIHTLRDRLGAVLKERGEIAQTKLDDASIERLMQLRRAREHLSKRLAELELKILPACRSCAHD